MSHFRTPAARSRYVKSRRDSLPFAAALLSLLYTVLGVLAVSRSVSRNVPLSQSKREGVPPLLLPTSVRSAGYGANFCDGTSPTNFLRSSDRVWLALLFPAIVFTFVGLALVTDDFFVPALERICECLDLSADVAGATFMAAGSSAPELFTSMLSVFFTKDDVGIGTIVGSAVFNVLIIIGLSAVLARDTLQLDFRPLLRDSFFYVVSILALLVMVLFSTRGRADWWEGLILMGGYVLYILFMKFGNKPYLKATKKWARKLSPEQDASATADKMENGIAPFDEETPTEEVTTSTETENVDDTLHKMTTIIFDDDIKPTQDDEDREDNTKEKRFLGVVLPTSTLGWATIPLFFPWQLLFRWTIVRCDTEKSKTWWPLTFAMSILWIMVVSYLMVEAARLAGCFIGIPSSVMGLTVLAAGTSVPDALASVAVARNGHGDMAVSNAIGSNVFDILLGLGLPWFIGGLAKRKAQLVTVDPVGLVVIPIGILFCTVIVLVSVLALLKWKLSKKLGIILFALYAAFLTYSLLDVFVFKIGGT